MNQQSTLTVTTPEHVVFTLQPAGLGRRLAATVIDTLIITCLIFAFYRLLLLCQLSDMIADGMTAFAAAVGTWIYHILFECRHAGQTPGKRTFGLRVIDAGGMPE